MPEVSVVVVAYGPEPWLERSVHAILASTGLDVEVILVDNGCTDGAVESLEGLIGLTILRPGRNLGFAGGCNAGVEAARAGVIALINPDAVVEPDALLALSKRVTSEGSVGIATACVVLADRPDRLNSAGNQIHCSGLSWSGSFEELVVDHAEERDVLAASGAACALRREVWDALAGFDETFFAYYEDAQLSLRCWQQGWRVIYVPDAVVTHRYEFSRRHEKMELLERNRWQLVLTCFGPRLLAVAVPILVTLELGILGMAAVHGWLPQKLRSMAWILSHGRDLRRRRRDVQAARTVPDAVIAPMFSVDLLPANVPVPRWFGVVNRSYRLWWIICRRFV